MTSRKRIIKLARQISESEVIAFLTTDGLSVSDWTIKDGELITYRQSDGQEMICMMDNEVLAFAICQYLEKHNSADL